MARRYKLRLGDGTLLLVDQGGLNTWLVDDKAMVQAAGGRWHPLKEVVARQSAAAKYASQQSSARAALPLVYPKPREDKTPRGAPAPSAGEPVEPPAIGGPAGVQALAEEPTRPVDEHTRREWIAEQARPSKPLHEDEALRLPESPSQSEPLGLSRSEPLDLRAWVDEPAIPSTEPLSTEPLAYEAPPDEETPVIPPKPLEDEALQRPAPPPWRDPIEPPSLGARPGVQVLADDPDARDGYTRRPSTSDDGLPAISLKPLDDRGEAHPAAPTGPGTYEEEQHDFVEEAPRDFVLDERLVRPVDAFGRFLSRWLDRLDRWYRRSRPTPHDSPATWRAAGSWPSAPDEPHPSGRVPVGLQVLAEEPTAPREDARQPAIADEGPILRLKPLDGDGMSFRPARNLLRSLGSMASAWASGLRGRVDRLARRYRPGPSGPSTEPGVSSPPDPAPREPLKAPLPISELPILRLVDIHEPEEAEDVYEGGGESSFHAAWLGTKRIVLLTGLAAGGVLAALTWETWFPKVAHVGGVAFTEVGEYLRSREQTEREQRALQEATEQLPHLTPATVRLILSGSPTGVLDPPEVFQRARDAVDRGVSALTSGEAEELKALQSTLVGSLSPAEGERLREYDRARARRATFAFEDRNALELFARGVRALPSESRERLQALSGKAIATGLAPPQPDLASEPRRAR